MTDKVTYTIHATPEDAPVRGHYGDEELESAILHRLDRGSVWAWASVEVRASLTADGETFAGSDYLGCCSYESEDDFIASSGYYEDMCQRALADLIATVKRTHAAAAKAVLTDEQKEQIIHHAQQAYEIAAGEGNISFAEYRTGPLESLEKYAQYAQMYGLGSEPLAYRGAEIDVWLDAWAACKAFEADVKLERELEQKPYIHYEIPADDATGACWKCGKAAGHDELGMACPACWEAMETEEHGPAKEGR